MSALKIDADTLFRAVTSHEYKVMAYYLDLRDGAITSRTLMPDEVKEPPRGPSVKPLPVLGGNLNAPQPNAHSPFGPAPVKKKGDLFGGDSTPKNNAFDSSFWSKEKSDNSGIFGSDGHKHQSGAKKIAELFGEKAPANETANPFEAPSQSKTKPSTRTPAPKKASNNTLPEIDLDDPLQRIPPASEQQVLEWHQVFARDCGDPKIQEKLVIALGSKNKPMDAFERVLGKYQRLEQQWRMYFRKQSLHYAAAWLKLLPIQWEIIDA